GFNLQRAARGVDQIGAANGAVALELAQKLKIENSLRRRRRGQRASKNLGAAEKGVELILAVKALDADKRLRRSAPAGDAEAKPRERRGRSGAEHAEPHDPACDPARRGRRVSR